MTRSTTVSVDGKQIGGTLTAHASHTAGQSDTVTVSGDWGPGDHQVSINFLNDAYATPYSPSTDRNLYVDGATYNGTDVSGSKLTLMSAGVQAVTVHDITAVPTASTSISTPISAGIGSGSGSDKLVLKISQDAYQGDAQYTVSVDGKQIGGTLTAHASHTAGQSDTVTVSGDWGPATIRLASTSSTMPMPPPTRPAPTATCTSTAPPTMARTCPAASSRS